MIVLTVLSYNGTPADGPSASFDELGGTVGRADNNQLVLPDPERTISRVHARIVFRTSGYTIVDNGSNPISVNGSVLGSGREQPLQPGDEVEIGGYRLAVSAGGAAPASASDPFADLFGEAAAGPPPAPPPARSPMASWPTPAPPPAPAWPSAAPGAAGGGAQIPDDWDPFAPDHAPAPRAPAAPVFEMPAGGDSLDDLFDLKGSPPAADPLGAASQQAYAMQPNTAAHADPLRALGMPAAVVPPSTGYAGSELNTPMPLPPQPASLPAGAIFSWETPSRDGRVVTLPGVRRTQADFELPVAAPPPAPPTPARAEPPRTQPAAPPSADDAELLGALLRGLGSHGLRIDRLTPELMELVGRLLRESTRGAVELLVARAALKRELRAEMTMIVARENNPLKFSPSVEVALQHLLSPPAPGFMPAVPAVRDAFDDLRAHQLGVMAGMKAALDGVLQRFDPQQLEGKLAKKSGLSSLIPSSRKARLWELFQELFGQLTAEAQDDFDELFGKAFLRAYQAQLDRLQNELQSESEGR
jgi:FHA domain-containing protein